MWNKVVDVKLETHCELLPRELEFRIPVCRDELMKKYNRLMYWKIQNYEFEKIDIDTLDKYICKRCIE